MSDEQVMEAVKSGDLRQASLLFERYHKPLFNFLAKMTLERAHAEDLTQNVFLRMIRYRSSYKEGMKFKAWIYQVARNVFSDHYQATKNKRADFVEVEKMADRIMDIEENSQLEEKEQLLHQSLALLSEEQRELLVLTRFKHLKYEEVALLLDTSVANIKVKVHRAIGKLREHYFQLEKT